LTFRDSTNKQRRSKLTEGEIIMLMNRVIGAFTFKREVFAEVEQDKSFTSTAWLIVVVVSLLNQIGSLVSSSPVGILNWILGALIGTAFAVVGFALAVFVIGFVGKSLFKADVSFEELVRTLGLAYVWNVLGFLGILGAISTALLCVVSPALLIGLLLGLIAWFIAVKEALDLEWLQTIITVVIGFIVVLVVNLIAGAVLGLLGIAGASLLGML
jgi:Yip1 domain